MVGILAQDDDFYLLERRQIKSVEDQFARRINHFAGFFFLSQEAGKALKIGLLELTLEYFLPALFDLDVAHWRMTLRVGER